VVSYLILFCCFDATTIVTYSGFHPCRRCCVLTPAFACSLARSNRDCIVKEKNVETNEVLVHYIGGTEDENEWVAFTPGKVQLPHCIEMVWAKVRDGPVGGPWKRNTHAHAADGRSASAVGRGGASQENTPVSRDAGPAARALSMQGLPSSSSRQQDSAGTSSVTSCNVFFLGCWLPVQWPAVVLEGSLRDSLCKKLKVFHLKDMTSYPVARKSCTPITAGFCVCVCVCVCLRVCLCL